MKALVLTIMATMFMLSSGVAWGKVDCNRHKLYCTIVKLKPKINKAFAMRLSNAIYKYSKQYNVDPYRAIAIMTQESGINMDARNTRSRTKTHKECDAWEKCTITKITTSETSDFGLFQFHINTMKHFDLDVRRVMTDMDFTTHFAIKMIRDKIRACSKKWPDTPWACYNSATEGKHQTYVKLVNRYYMGNNK